MEDWGEEIEKYFSDDELSIEKTPLLSERIKRFAVKRDEHHQIILETVFDGYPTHVREEVPAGTIYQNRNEVIFYHKYNQGRGVARSVTFRGSSSQGRSGNIETVETFSVHAIDLSFENPDDPHYLVEWIDNLSDSYIWPASVNTKESTNSSTELDWKSDKIVVTSTTGTQGGSWAALHLNLLGYDLVVVKDRKASKGRAGKIAYREAPDQTIREKIRDVISFIIGRYIVYYGNTTFSKTWYPCSYGAISAYSLEDRVFKLHSLPPYPIFKNSLRNVIDGDSTQTACTALLQAYEQLDFQKLSWAYWHAMCAPYHIEAAHFGALIKKTQASCSSSVLEEHERRLVDPDLWREIRPKMAGLITATDIDQATSTILLNALDNLNRLPQNSILTRLFSKLGVPLGEAESRAWKQRNDSAHGNMKADYRAILLNNKLLRIIFHRMIAGMTGCCDRYVDYYNLHFPDRELQQPIPYRSS